MKRTVSISDISAFNLTSKSFFPEELPPCFSSTKLGAYVGSYGKNKISQLLEKKNQAIKVEQIDTYGARYGGLLRNYSTPSPMAFVKICLEVERSKDEIEKHLSQVSLSASLPTTKHNYRGLGLTYRFGELEELKTRYAKSNPWILKTDISNFYPSIYTHSIAWALHGKLFAKQNIRNWAMLGNRLDRFISNGQYAETRGIPIGPDTSRLISEIILHPIDACLASRKARGIRYMDDYSLFCTTQEEAQELLGVLQIELMKYKLNINSKKTEIIEHNGFFSSEWVKPLTKEIYKNPHTINARDKYQDLLEKYFKNYPQTPVIKYIFSCIRNHTVTSKISTEHLELLIKCIDYEPALISEIIRFLYWRADKTTLDYSDRIIEKFEEWGPKCIRLGYHIELTWMLWFCLAKGWKLSANLFRKISEIESNFISLLILAHIEKGLASQINFGPFDDMFSLHDNPEYLGDWLLRYQCSLQGWIDPNHLKNIDLWNLFENNISFFHENIGDTNWAIQRDEMY